MITLLCGITSFEKGETYYLYSRHITELNMPINSKSDLKMPSFGVVSNTGNIGFSKYGAEYIMSQVRNGYLRKGDPIAISFVKDNSIFAEVFNGYVKSIGNDGKTLDITDGLEEWQNRTVPRRDYNWENPSATAKDVYDYLRDFSWQLEGTSKSKVPAIPDFSSLDIKTQNILSTTYIPNYFLEEDNLWNQYNKLCTLCMCYIHKQNLKAKFEYKGGR